MASPLPSPACLPFVPSPTVATAKPSAAASSSSTSAPAIFHPSSAATRCAATAARGRVRTASTAAVASSCSLWEMRREPARDTKEGAAAAAGRGLFSKQFLPRGTVILSSQTPLVWTAACSSNVCCCGSWPPSPQSSSTSSYSSSSNNESKAQKGISLLRENHRADQLTPCAYCLAPPNHVTSSYPTFRMQQQSRRYDARGKALRCSGCSCTFYCSAACQRDAWAEHRRECPIIHSLFIWSRGAFPTPTQRLLIRLLLQNVSLEAFTAGPRRSTQSLVSPSAPAEAAFVTTPAEARQRHLKAAETAATACAAVPAAGAAAPTAGAAVPAVSAAAPTAEAAAAVALSSARRAAEGRTEKDMLTERDSEVACASPKGDSEGETTWRMSPGAAAADERGASSAQGSPDAVEGKATYADASSIEEHSALLQFEQQLQRFIDVFETAVMGAAAAAAKAAADAKAAANAEAAVAATAAAEGRRTTQGAVAAGGASVGAKWKEEGAVRGVAARKAAAAAGRPAAGERGTNAAAAATAARATAVALFAELVRAAGSATLKTVAAKITRNAVSVLLCAEEGEVCCSTAAAAADRSRSRGVNDSSSCSVPRNSGSKRKSSSICMKMNSTSSSGSSGTSSTGHSCSSGSSVNHLRDKSSSRDLGTSASSRSRIMTLNSNQSGSSKCSCCFRGSQCAVGLYPPPLCWVNHACSSNAVLIFGAVPQRLSVSLVASRDIWKGEEIFISYTPRMQPQQQRKETLLSIYGFLCQCALCCCFLRSPQSLLEESKKRQHQVEALQQTQQQQRTQDLQKEKPQQMEQQQHEGSNVEKKQHQEELEQVEKRRQRPRDLKQQRLQDRSEENQHKDGETAEDFYGNEKEGGYSSTSNSTSSSSTSSSTGSSNSSTSYSRTKTHEEEGCCAAEAFDKQLICLFCPSPSCMRRCCTTQGDALLMLDAAASQQSEQQQQNLQSNQVSDQRQQLKDEEQHQVLQQGQQQQLRMPLLLVYGRGSCAAAPSSTTDPRGARESSNTGPRVISLLDEDACFAGSAAVSLSDLCSRLRRSRVDSRYSSSCSSSECDSSSRLHEASSPDSSTRSSCSYLCSNTPGSCSSSTEPGDNTCSTAENNSSSSGIRFSDGKHRSSRWSFSDPSTRTYNSLDRHVTCCYARDSSLERPSSICSAANSNSLTSNTSSCMEKATGDCSLSVRCGVCRRDVSIDVLFAIQAAYDAIEEAFAAFLDGKPYTHMAAVAGVRAAAAAVGRDAAAAASSRRAAEKFGGAAGGDTNVAYHFSSSWLQFYWLLYGCTHPGNRYLYELREQLLLPSLLAYRDFYVPSALLLVIHQTRAAAAAHGQWTEEMAFALEREGRLLLTIAQDAKSTTDSRNIEAAMACYVWQVAEERTNLLHDTVGSNSLEEKSLPHVTTEELSLTLQQQHSQQKKDMPRQQTQHRRHLQRQQKQNPAEILLLHSCKSLTRACTIRCSLHTTPASHTREVERTLYDCRAELQEIYREKGGETNI